MGVDQITFSVGIKSYLLWHEHNLSTTGGGVGGSDFDVLWAFLAIYL